MKIGHDIHFESQDEFIAALADAYKKAKSEGGSLEQIRDTVGPLLLGLSDDDRRTLDSELWRRRENWVKQNPGNLANNPYTGIAYYVSPPVGGA